MFMDDDASLAGRQGNGSMCRGKEAETEDLDVDDFNAQRDDRGTGLLNRMNSERAQWKAHCDVLRSENEHLQHTVYLSALDLADATPLDSSTTERSDARSLRQQLACVGEHFQSLTDKMAKLQEQTAEAYRLLAQERRERMEERNNQLTVVVAKHGLERRMRTREQDLQAEWRRNAELSEKCQRLEEELAEARKGSSEGPAFSLPFRGSPKKSTRQEQELAAEDDWDDTPSHVPPEFGYSKFVRWKKRTREAHDHGPAQEKKQRMSVSGAGGLQLAGSESPPQMNEVEQVAPGASAIDHMIAGEFEES